MFFRTSKRLRSLQNVSSSLPVSSKLSLAQSSGFQFFYPVTWLSEISLQTARRYREPSPLFSILCTIFCRVFQLKLFTFNNFQDDLAKKWGMTLPTPTIFKSSAYELFNAPLLHPTFFKPDIL
jgi:hypothetical protein